MRVLLQRVSAGSVKVEGVVTGAIRSGLVALVGVTHADSIAEAEKLADKDSKSARIFADDDGKMNRSLLDVDGGARIGGFTIYALRRCA